MALILKDRVKVAATTTGTGTFALGAAANGFQDFAAIGDGNTTYYTIALQSGSEWEVGVGTVTDTGGGVYTLSRDTVLESSTGGTKVNFSAGTKDVFVTYPAERAVYLSAAGSAVDVLDIGTLGTSTANITTANITSGTVSTTPTSANDLANKAYVDTMVSSGIHFHAPVRVESPTPLTATYNNGTSGVGATLTNSGTQAALVIDGVIVSVNDRVLIYTQADATQNGIYVVTNVGSGSTNWVLTRASDADTYAAASSTSLGEGSTVFVQQGATGAGESYTCNTTGVITFGTTNITFAQISSAQIYSAGTGLTLSGTEFSITPVGTAATYGSASQVPVFTTNATGQVTSVTNTSISIGAGAVSGLAASATTDTTNAANISSGTLNSARLTGSYTGITGVGTLTAGTWNGSVIGPAYGGTGFGSYTTGDLLYADSASSLAKLAGVATGNALISGGVGTAPAWGKIGLQTHVSGTLQLANGGTGATDASGARTNLGLVIGTNVPSTTGTGASGTWGINITGNAATATSATSAGTATQVANTVTFNNSGTGAASGNGFNGSGALTVSYNTIGAPSTTGTNASGTWGINVTGNSATTSQRSFSGDISTTGQGRFTGWYTGNAATGIAAEIGMSGGQGYIFVYNRDTSTYGTLNIAAGAANMQFSGSTINVNSGALQQGGNQVLHAGNYNSYSPTLTGGGASGTWGISITGSAAQLGGYGSTTYIGKFGNSYYQADNWLQFNTSAGLYWPATNAAELNANTTSSYGAISIIGSRGGWRGIHFRDGGNTPHLMFDGSANGGIYYESGGRWASYYNYSNNCWGIGTSTTNSAYNIYCPTGVYSGGRVDGTIFYDSNDTGYYVDPSSTSNSALRMRGGALFGPNVTWGASLYVGTDGRVGTSATVAVTNGNLHMDSQNGYQMYLNYYSNENIFTGGNLGLGQTSASFRLAVNGTGSASSDFRAPIFYDSNDTAYYVDPASTSNLNTFTAATYARSGANYWVYNRTNNTTDANYYVGSQGWNESNTWDNVLNVYGSTFIDLWGPNRQHPQGNAYTHAQGLQILHYRDGGSTSYGWQLVGADGADSRWWLRGKWGTTYRPWYEIVLYGRNVGGELYANILYDSNNTGYYVDPASTSTIRKTNLIASGAGWDDGLNLYSSDGTNRWNLLVDSGASNAFRIAWNNAERLNFATGGAITAAGDFRAPIFYDSNDTGYYTDPASTSRMNKLSLNTIAITAGITSLTDAPIATQYANAGSTNTWYPMTYQRAQHNGGYVTHLNTGLYKTTVDWGSGSSGWYAAIGGNDSYPTQAWYLTYDALIQNSLGYVSTGGSFRAPIFYDSNNTGYYVDPNGTSVLYEVQAYNWFRVYGVTGLYSQSYGQHFYAKDSGDYWGITGDGGAQGGLVFYQNYESSQRGYVYWDSAGFGLLHSSGGWAVRTTTSLVEIYNRLDAPIMYDSSNTAFYVDPNGSTSLRTAGDWRANTSSWTGEFAGKIQYHDNSWYLQFSTAIRFRNSGGSDVVTISNGGNIAASGTVAASSDERLKTNWRELPEDFVARLAQVKAGVYDRIDKDNLTQVGVSAQSLQPLLPTAVEQDDNGMLSVAYGNAALVSAVKLAEKVLQLEQRIKQLEAR